MPDNHPGTTPGREAHAASRPRGGSRRKTPAVVGLAVATVVALGVVGAAYAASQPGDGDSAPRTADDLRLSLIHI